jgi:hypothetical protein
MAAPVFKPWAHVSVKEGEREIDGDGGGQQCRFLLAHLAETEKGEEGESWRTEMTALVME